MRTAAPALVLLSGCAAAPVDGTSSEDASTACFEAPPTLEIGTGVDAYEPLADLAPVEILSGPQGGYHMVAAMQTCHLDAVVTIHMQLVDEASGIVISEVAYSVQTLALEDCCHYRADMYNRLNISELPGGAGAHVPTYMDGRVVVYQLQVEDDFGNQASGTVRVTAQSSDVAP